MLLVIVGWLVPKVRRQAADAAIARIGTSGGFEAFDEAVDRLVERLESAASANARDSSIRRLPPDLRDQPTHYHQEHPALGDRLDWKPPSSTKPARLADEFPSLLGNFTSQT